jgi:hypothetical protein
MFTDTQAWIIVLSVLAIAVAAVIGLIRSL